MTKHKRGGFYKCQLAPFVTDWGGTILENKARKEVKEGDVVRVLVNTKEGDSCTRYVEIARINGEYLTGCVEDPYYGSVRGGCDECMKVFEWYSKVYYCPECESYNKGRRMGYHLCAGKCYAKNNHPHKKSMLREPLTNGTILTFRRNCISEIPNWTKNTTAIISKYKTNRRRGFTGDWNFPISIEFDEN